MKKFISLMVVAVLVLSMLAGCGKTSVTTDGSTSMEKVIGALGEAFQNDTGISVTYNPTGSGSGIKAVQEGRCDIGLSSRDLKAEEKASGLTRSFTTSATMPSSTTIPVEKLRLLLQSRRTLSRSASATPASVFLPNIRTRCLSGYIVWIRATPSSPGAPVLAFLS